jgi:hypothetical protein
MLGREMKVDGSSRPPTAATAAPAPRRVALKSVALPHEHGAWGFLLEPALLGLVLAPAWAGLLVVVSATAALLAQHPLSLALADRRRGREYPRTRLARAFALAYGSVACLALAAALVALGRLDVVLPALLAAPLALVQLTYDARHRGRELLPELAGASAIGALAAVVAMAGGWSLPWALLLWLVLAARTIPSIVYVRARLRLETGRPADRRAVLGSHVAALALVIALAAFGLLPALTVGAFVVLLVRAALGMSRWRRPTKAMLIGLRELGFGLLVVAATAAGFALGA